MNHHFRIVGGCPDFDKLVSIWNLLCSYLKNYRLTNLMFKMTALLVPWCEYSGDYSYHGVATEIITYSTLVHKELS